MSTHPFPLPVFGETSLLQNIYYFEMDLSHFEMDLSFPKLTVKRRRSFGQSFSES